MHNRPSEDSTGQTDLQARLLMRNLKSEDWVKLHFNRGLKRITCNLKTDLVKLTCTKRGFLCITIRLKTELVKLICKAALVLDIIGY